MTSTLLLIQWTDAQGQEHRRVYLRATAGRKKRRELEQQGIVVRTWMGTVDWERV